MKETKFYSPKGTEINPNGLTAITHNFIYDSEKDAIYFTNLIRDYRSLQTESRLNKSISYYKRNIGGLHMYSYNAKSTIRDMI